MTTTWISAAVFVMAQQLAAQTSVTGLVVERRSGNPLEGAAIRVVGAAAEVRSDGRGAFRLNVESSDATLHVTRIGYAPIDVRLRDVRDALRIEMDQKVVDLDAIVVTGQPGAAEVRTLGNAVGRIDVSSVVRSAPPEKLQDLLSVNVPGVRVMSGGGGVGIGGTTRIRGAGSLTLGNEPLIYLDGVRVDNSSGNGNAAYGRGFNYAWEVPSRINDIDPNEIQSIEILKGPAAAALYGTEAATGVIQIISKRGGLGAPTFDSRSSAGFNWLPHQGSRWSPAWYVNSAGTLASFNVLKHNRALGYPDPFTTGHPVSQGVSIAGGASSVRYFGSVDAAREEGILSYNWQNKLNARGNLSYSGRRVEIEANAGMVRSRTRTASGAFPLSTWIAFVDCAPDGQKCRDRDAMATDTTFFRGFAGPRPEDYPNTVFAYDDIVRSTLGLRVTSAPRPWLKHRLQLGLDVASNDGDDMVEKDPSTGLGLAQRGLRALSHQRTTHNTIDYAASVRGTLWAGVGSESSVGVQYYSKTRDFWTIVGRQFAVTGPVDINGAVLVERSQIYVPNKTLGMYVQQQLDWNRRLFVTGALRGDDNSSFGANYDLVLYPKLSLSWVMSDEDFFARRFPQLGTFKFRAAYGRAGQQPDAFSAVRQYQPVEAFNGQPGLTPAVPGNPDLRPEVGREFELGFDASTARERVSAEFTWYNKVLDDAIIAAPIRPSSGFAGTRLINAGRTTNSGIEIGIATTLVSREAAIWSMRGTLATNNSIVNRLLTGQDALLAVGELVHQYNVVGFAPYSYFYPRVVGSNVLTEPDTTKWKAYCEGGAAFTKGNEAVVSCDSANALYHGRPTPRLSASVSSTLRLKHGLELFALVDIVSGNSILSGEVAFGNALPASRVGVATKAVMDSVRAHGTFVGTQSVLPQADARMAGYLLLNSPLNFEMLGLLKNGFARLRTVSATYPLSERLASRAGASRGSITIAAQNVAMLWRQQASLYGHRLSDPEIAQINNANGLTSYQQERWPLTTRLTCTLRLSY